MDEAAKKVRTRNEVAGRSPARFPDLLERGLLAYVAAAVGIAATAVAQPAEGEVVYTPVNQSIWANGGFLDLNNDGINDFAFRVMTYVGHTSHAISVGYGLYIRPEMQSNAIRGGGSALPSSVLVGKNQQKFQRGSGFVADWLTIRWLRSTFPRIYETGGQFANTSGRYLGLQFTINGEVHYGWARLNVTVSAKQHEMSATLTGYAYETTPGAPIFTGKQFGNEMRSPQPPATKSPTSDAKPGSPATLGHLAQGSQGLVAWRKTAPAAQ